MIAGIVASQASGAEALTETGTVLDFVNGTYVVDGTSYNITDLFGSPPTANTGFVGDVDFDAVVPGRGWLHDFDSNQNESIVIGPLDAILREPYSIIIEWEDIDDYWTEWHVIRTSSVFANVPLDGSTADLYFFNFPYCGTPAPGSEYNYSGTNRIAWTVGNAASAISVNGSSTTTFGPINTTTVFAETYYTDGASRIHLFGYGDSVGAAVGYVRKVTILPARANNLDLEDLSIPNVPAMITDLGATSVTDTAMTLTFTPPAGTVTGYEVWVRTSGSPRPADNAWAPLDPSFVITGLTASTSYRVFIRGVNANGPGGANRTALVQATTA
jgi:hypothetical protein